MTDVPTEQHTPGEPAPVGGFMPVLILLLYFFVVVVAIFFVSILVTIVLALTGLPVGFDPGFEFDLTFLTISWTALAISIVLVTVAFVVFVDRRPVKTLGMAREGAWKLDIGLGLILGFGLPLLMFVMSYAAGWTTIVGSLFQEPAGYVLAVTFQTLLLMLAVSVGEELMIRGYVLQTLRWGYGAIVALVVSSLVFGAAHFMNPGAAFPGFLGTTAAGFVLGYGYLVTGRLWLPIAFHFGWNFALGPIIGFPVSGIDIYSWIEQRPDGPLIWTGGDFGPEAGLLGIIVLLIGVEVIRRFAPRMDRFPTPRPGRAGLVRIE